MSMMNSNYDYDVIVIGGGLAGLGCARRVIDEGLSCRLLEASDAVGGRVRTDQVDGFQLDRGFQVLLTAYPSATEVLDYDQLDLRPFEPGALVRYGGRFYRFCDPWRRPQHMIKVALSAVGSLSDKLKMGRLRNRVTACELEELLRGPNVPTLQALREEGFSEQIIERFFRPFLGGVFLDHRLSTSSRVFDFVFRMFATGDAALPAAGMEAIPRQLAAGLPADVIRTNNEVVEIEGRTVTLSSGERLRGRAVVVALEQPAAARLLDAEQPVKGRRVACLYFATDQPPVEEPILVLNGDGDGPINNLAVVNQVAPSYASADEHLVSVSVLSGLEASDRQILRRVRLQLVDWFGTPATPWRHLRTYRIEHALPTQTPACMDPVAKKAERKPGLFVCGDYCDVASIEGALISGRRAAEAAVKSLRSARMANQVECSVRP
jgi:phytoene dehydrogenase-like protein